MCQEVNRLISAMKRCLLVGATLHNLSVLTDRTQTGSGYGAAEMAGGY